MLPLGSGELDVAKGRHNDMNLRYLLAASAVVLTACSTSVDADSTSDLARTGDCCTIR